MTTTQTHTPKYANSLAALQRAWEAADRKIAQPHPAEQRLGYRSTHPASRGVGVPA